jgi:hypothetical protein
MTKGGGVMASRGAVAAKVRAAKEAHPELFCAVPRCLWRTGGAHGTPCRKHPVSAPLDGSGNTLVPCSSCGAVIALIACGTCDACWEKENATQGERT